MKIRNLAAWTLAVGLAGLASCLSAPDAPSYRFIEPVVPLERFTERAASESIAPVRLVELAGSDAARDVLTWRASDGSLRRANGVRWSSPPADVLRRLTLEHLVAIGAADVPGTLPRASRRLVVEVLHFGGAEGSGGTEAQIRAFATVETAEGALLVAREYQVGAALSGGSAALSSGSAELCEALGALSVELVERIVLDATR